MTGFLDEKKKKKKREEDEKRLGIQDGYYGREGVWIRMSGAGSWFWSVKGLRI